MPCMLIKKFHLIQVIKPNERKGRRPMSSVNEKYLEQKCMGVSKVFKQITSMSIILVCHIVYMLFKYCTEKPKKIRCYSV